MSHLIVPCIVSSVFLCVGILLVSPMWRATDGRTLSLGWIYGVGLVCSTYILFLVNAVHGNIHSSGVRLSLVLVFLLGILQWLRKGRPLRAYLKKCINSCIPKHISISIGICMFLISLAVITLWLEASALPIYHLDTVLSFGYKTKILFEKGTFYTPHFLDNQIIHDYPKYPLLIPYMQAIVYWVIGKVQDDAIRILHWFLWIAWISLIFERLRNRLEKNLAWLLFTIFVTLPAFFLDHETQAVAGIGDIPMAFFWTGTVIAALYYLETARREELVLMSLMSIGCMFTKPNGLVLIVMAWVGLWIFRKNRFVLYGALLTTVVHFPWLWIQHNLPNDSVLPQVSLMNLSALASVDRLGSFLLALFQETFDFRYNGIFWIVIGVLGLINFRKSDSSMYLLALGAGQVFAYIFYISINGLDVIVYLGYQWQRWMLHVIPIAVLLVCECLSPSLSVVSE